MTDDYQTLLTPGNMLAFYDLYERGMYASIYTRFNLTEQQTKWMYGYLEKMVDLQLQ